MDENRVWRQDRGAVLSGVCTGLAEDLDLPLPLIRLVTVLFFILPTGLAYLALSMLLRRRPLRRPMRFSGTSYQSAQSHQAGGPARFADMPAGKPPVQNFALLVHRFEALEPRLKRIEAFVTSKDFELERGFRKMGE